jgi:hypothetical protein
VLYQAAGLDVSCRRFHDVTLRGRLHVNLEQSAIETAELAAQWQARDNLSVALLGRNAVPRVFEDSFFATFLDKTSTSSVRGSCKWNFDDDMYLSGSGTTVFSESDMLYKVRAGIGIPELEVGYTHWLAADKGDMDGFYGQLLFDATNTVDANAGFDYSRGSNSEVRPNTESQVIWIGCGWSPSHSFSISARGEQLRDVAHSEDLRALFSISSNFTTLK